MNSLIQNAKALLDKGNFDYSFCGGYAIELFLNRAIRKHGDIDISVYWGERDIIILYMQSLGWSVYEMCGNGIAHHITNVENQIKSKRNIFCLRDDCDIVALTALNETDMYRLECNHKGQTSLNFIEFLFNDRSASVFLYARNKEIRLPLPKAILYQADIPYLAPEIVLLYKSTDIHREGYELDYRMAVSIMSTPQKLWLRDALLKMNPHGHEWVYGCG